MWKNGTEKTRNERRRKRRYKNPAEAKRDEKAVSGQFSAGPFLFCVPAVQRSGDFQEHGRL